MISCWVCANLFKLADVPVQIHPRCHHRPQIADFLLPDIEQAGSVGDEQPFVKTGGIVVTVQIAVLEVDMSEDMRPEPELRTVGERFPRVSPSASRS